MLSLNTSIDGQSQSTVSEVATTAASEKKRSQSDVLSVAEVSPEFASQESINEGLLVIARAQIKAGDYQGARATLNEIEARNPNNVEAKSLVIALSKKVAQVQGKNLYKTRSEMLNAVDESWERPKVFEIENEAVQVESSQSILEGQIKTIRFQESINFRGCNSQE